MKTDQKNNSERSFPEGLPVEITAALGELPSAVHPIVGKGEANTVLSVLTSKGRLIVRFQAGSDAYKTYVKEEWCIGQAKQAGIPCAEVILVGRGETCSFMIQRQLEGTHGADWQGDMKHVWHELGRYSAILNSIRVKGFGESLKDPANGDFVNTWKGIVDWSMDYLFSDSFLVNNEIISGRQRETISARLNEMYTWTFDPVLTHGNLAPKNAIVDATNRVHLIDWGTAGAHRGVHLELSEIMTWEPDEKYVKAFLDGYGLSAGDLIEIQRDVDTLILLRLLDSIRWAAERRADWRNVSFVKHCLSKLPKFCERL